MSSTNTNNSSGAGTSAIASASAGTTRSDEDESGQQRRQREATTTTAVVVVGGDSGGGERQRQQQQRQQQQGTSSSAPRPPPPSSFSSQRHRRTMPPPPSLSQQQQQQQHQESSSSKKHVPLKKRHSRIFVSLPPPPPLDVFDDAVGKKDAEEEEEERTSARTNDDNDNGCSGITGTTTTTKTTTTSANRNGGGGGAAAAAGEAVVQATAAAAAFAAEGGGCVAPPPPPPPSREEAEVGAAAATAAAAAERRPEPLGGTAADDDETTTTEHQRQQQQQQQQQQQPFHNLIEEKRRKREVQLLMNNEKKKNKKKETNRKQAVVDGGATASLSSRGLVDDDDEEERHDDDDGVANDAAVSAADRAARATTTTTKKKKTTAATATAATATEAKRKKKKKKKDVAAPATATTAAAANDVDVVGEKSSSKKTKRKRFSPFRLKVGCVAALRFRPEGNLLRCVVVVAARSTKTAAETGTGTGDVRNSGTANGSSTSEYNNNPQHQQQQHHHLQPQPLQYISVWTSPVAGRDDGLALLGKRVRCILPQSMVVRATSATATADEKGDRTPDPGKKGKNRRSSVFEGEVIRYLDSNIFGNTAANNATIKRGKPIRVELLVSVSVLEQFPFLPRSDADDAAAAAAASAAAAAADGAAGKKSHQRNARIEETIRGKNTACIYMKLAHPAVLASLTSTSTSSSDPAPVAKTGIVWAVQKRVPSKLFYRPPMPRAAPAPPSSASPQEPQQQEPQPQLPEGQGDGKKNPGTSHTVTGEDANNTTIGIPSDNYGKAVKAKSAFADGSLSIKTVTTATTKLVDNEKDSSGKSGHHRKSPRSLPTSAAPRHVGDGNDPPNQQILNWRWLASRYSDMTLFSESVENNTNMNDASVDDGSSSRNSSRRTENESTYREELLSHGFVGEVLEVDATATKTFQPSATTLATVTLRPLVLPEYTVTGRLPHHGIFDVFVDRDNTAAVVPSSDQQRAVQQSQFLVQVPIEELVIVGRKCTRVEVNNADAVEEHSSSFDKLVIRRSYSFRNDVYYPLSHHPSTAKKASPDTDLDLTYCHRCRRILEDEQDALQCASDDCPLSGPGSKASTYFCRACVRACKAMYNAQNDNVMFEDSDGEEDEELDLPCCLGSCGCRRCQSFLGSELHEDLRTIVADSEDAHTNDAAVAGSIFAVPTAVSKSLDTAVDFGLPNDFLDPSTLPKPLAQPSTRTKIARSPKRPSKYVSSGVFSKPTSPRLRRPAFGKPKSSIGGAKEDAGTVSKKPDSAPTRPAEDYTVFRPTCARLLDYYESRRHKNRGYESFSSASSDRVRNLRQENVEKMGDAVEKDDKLSSRAARANQRRLMKDVAAFGAIGLGVDALANREPQLRFDRSGIHAWGVFADEDIAADVMVVEYRGVLIGNAVAEKREKEYNAAKIGSDYMFRIDGNIVCDATKQGNVARFINASCDPNCYTKIITLDGNKRIVIYTKREISAGEELCYDYKFPLEYDPSKRIPCHCGAENCRGYMNWVRLGLSRDIVSYFLAMKTNLISSLFFHFLGSIRLCHQDKRYVAVPSPDSTAASPDKTWSDDDGAGKTTSSREGGNVGVRTKRGTGEISGDTWPCQDPPKKIKRERY